MQGNQPTVQHWIRWQSSWLWLYIVLVLVIESVGFYLFYLNTGTAVPESWGSEGGARNQLPDWFNAIQQSLVLPLLATTFGVLIVRQRPRQRIGWLLIVVGLLSSTMVLLQEWAIYGYYTAGGSVRGWPLSGWVTNWIWAIFFSIILLLVALFPNGSFLSRRWQKLIVVLLGLFLIPVMAGATIETPMSSAALIPNPFVEEHQQVLYNTLFSLGVPFMFITTLIVFVAVIVRFRRSQGRERQQMKWLLAAMGLMAVIVAAGLVLSLLDQTVGDLMVNMSALLPLAGIGVALLRHRLYDIDIIIRRTVLYTAVSALLLVIYFGSALLLQQLLSPLIGQQSDAIIVFSTLLIAALFTPLRRRIQNVIDSRFYRKKYDAQKVLAQFAQTARDEVDMGALQAELLQVVQETLRPEHVSLWIQKKR